MSFIAGGRSPATARPPRGPPLRVGLFLVNSLVGDVLWLAFGTPL